jgi:chromosome segregation ATPase
LIHLKNIIERLSKELKKCQYIMGVEAPSLEDVYLGVHEKSEEFSELLSIMNSSYYMSPLLLAYDDHFYTVEKELNAAHLEISRLHENMRILQQENGKLSDNLELKIREYSKLVSRTIENSDILIDFQVEKAEMDERLHLLTEENQMLLEQVTLLKQHYDTFNNDYVEKVEDAEKKISSYDSLNEQFHSVYKDLVEHQKNNQFLETKVREKERTLGMIEEKRKNEVKELNRLRTEHGLMQQEVSYYKDQVDKLNYRIGQDRETIDKQVRLGKDKEMSSQDIVMRIEQDLERAKNECRKLNKHLKEKQTELNEVVKLNNDYQSQIQELRDKEFEASGLGRDYKERIEKLKLEQEKFKLKEDNYIKQIRKLEEDNKYEMARKEEKYEAMLAAKESRSTKKYDELDDKYTQVLSEIDHYKSMLEKKEVMILQLEGEINNFNRKEAKIREQYEAQLKELQVSYRNLQLDLNRLEADKEKYEISLDKQSRDHRNNERRLESQIEDLKQDLENAKDDIEILREEKRKLNDRFQNLA